MQLLPQRSHQLDQPAFHGEVHILGFQARLELAGSRFVTHPIQGLDQAAGLRLGQHATAPEHAGMGDRAIQILLQKVDVKTDRGVEALDHRMQTLLEAIAPAAHPAAGAPRPGRWRRRAGGGGHGDGVGTALQLGIEVEGGGNDGSITSSRTFKTTIEASSSGWRPAPTKRSRRWNN